MNSPDHLPVERLPEQAIPDQAIPEQTLPGQRLPDEDVRDRSLNHSLNHSGTAVALGTDAIGSLQSLLGTVVIAVFVITFIVQAFQIPSPSMENTLLVGDYLLVDKLCYGGGVGDHVMPYRRVRRGDIVVFHYPITPAQHFVKRVIGVPGDRVRLVNKQVFVNGVALKEPYAHFTRPANDLFRDNFPRLDVAPGETPDWWLLLRKLVEDGQLIVPEGHYFVMGDNRDDSYDSRYWGFVPGANIIGRPLLIYWSVRGAEGESITPSSVGDKLYHFAYAFTHLFQITRWNRTLRLVN
ncbi:MAG TPA: signal peptidase I [Candidatus Eremiobacteraceae bacterium]|nr:signal peptidase I [Candidatus Eremiobacteraceae bacterium]